MLAAPPHLFDKILSSWDVCHEIMNYQKLQEKKSPEFFDGAFAINLYSFKFHPWVWHHKTEFFIYYHFITSDVRINLFLELIQHSNEQNTNLVSLKIMKSHYPTAI